MAHHHHYTRPEVEQYNMDPKVKTVSMILLVLGAILFGIGVVTNLDALPRIFGTMLHNTYFFLGIGLTGLFYVAAQTVGYSGWVILVSRISEAVAKCIPIFSVIMAVVLVLGWRHIYEWAHPGIMEQDALIASKKGFLNPMFFFGATAVYLVLWSLMSYLIRKNSIANDTDPGMHRYVKSKRLAMIFLVIFAVSTSTALWHWFMSIDPHWFSTLYGWYCFISIFVTSIAVTILIVLYLKSKGHLKSVGTEHFHDLGKWMFAFSVAWAYLWFAQFMLIWYSNIPEETLYFNDRFIHYKVKFILTFFINFPLPFLVLMTARAKRNPNAIGFIAVMVIIGHWLDFYMLTMPGVIKHAHLTDGSGNQIFNYGIGLLEIGFPMMLAGIFIYTVFSTLEKHSLVPVNHPFLRQSVEHATHSI